MSLGETTFNKNAFRSGFAQIRNKNNNKYCHCHYDIFTNRIVFFFHGFALYNSLFQYVYC